MATRAYCLQRAAELDESAKRARARAKVERARPYEGWGNTPEDVAKYWRNIAKQDAIAAGKFRTAAARLVRSDSPGLLYINGVNPVPVRSFPEWTLMTCLTDSCLVKIGTWQDETTPRTAHPVRFTPTATAMRGGAQ